MSFPVAVRRWYGQAPATVLTCGFILAVYVVTAVQSRSLLDNLPGSALADAWVLYLPDMGATWAGPLRALGTTFLHIGPAHVLMNLLLLFLFGRELETVYGTAVFMAVYVISGIGASAFSLWQAPQQAAAGASGVGYALMALLVLIIAQRGGELRTPLVLIAMNLVFSLTTPDIALWGHVGGLVVGAVIALVLWLVPAGWPRWSAVLLLLGVAIGSVLMQIVSFFPHGWVATNLLP